MKMDTLPKLENNIAKQAVKIWRLTNILWEISIYLVFIALLFLSYYFTWIDWIRVVLWVLICIMPLGMIWSIGFEPRLKQRYWKYGVNERFVYLKHGRFFSTQIVIPMTKVQYVEAEQGPLLRKYQLYTLTIGTLGASHAIPALPEVEALALRAHISNEARLKEVES